LRDFTDKDRIALPAVEAHRPRDRAADGGGQEWGRRNYDSSIPITVSLSHPDATAALLTGKSEINAHFASSPFYYIELGRARRCTRCCIPTTSRVAPHQRRADDVEEILRRQSENLRRVVAALERGERLHQGQSAQAAEDLRRE
jgi:hypothetical protein